MKVQHASSGWHVLQTELRCCLFPRNDVTIGSIEQVCDSSVGLVDKDLHADLTAGDICLSSTAASAFGCNVR